MQLDLVSVGQGQHERGRARPRADDRMDHPGPDPLVDQGRREGGLGVAARYAHRSWPPCTPSRPARDPPWCWPTGSPRPAVCGVDSAQLVGQGRRVVSVDLPGHGGSGEIEADLVAGGALLVEAGGARAVRPARLLARGTLRPARGPRRSRIASPDWSSSARPRASKPTRHEPSAGGETTRPPRNSPVSPTSTRSSRRGLPRRCSPRCETPGATNAAAILPPGLASSLRLAGAGTQTPLWDPPRRVDDAGAGAGRRHRPAIPGVGGAPGRVASLTAPSRSSRGPATPPTSSSPTSPRRSCARGSPRPTHRSAEGGLTARSRS